MCIRIRLTVLITFLCMPLVGQEATEIYLFNLREEEGQVRISDPVNISNNIGYDNQPSFSDDGSYLFFASQRKDQIDIARYDLNQKFRLWLTDTHANEFSPASYPGKRKYFTCVRQDENGSQRLYRYAYKGKTPEVLLPDITVGYYLWYNKKVLISFVLGDVETLQVSNFRYGIKYPIQRNIGRSIQKIPVALSLGTNLVSFISLEHEEPEIYAIDPLSSEVLYLADALEGSQDLAWTLQGTMLMGRENEIYKFNPATDEEWTPVQIECELPLKGITRMAVSPNGKMIAVVVAE